MNGTLSFFGSPEGRVVKKGTAVEYQYAISDHQGNTRIVFTSATNTPTANETSFETPSASFEREDVLLSTMNEMKRTGTTSQRLIGGYNSQVGATMSLKVYPGDKVKAEVYAKYRNSSSNPGNLTQFAAALTGAFGLSSGGSGEALNAYNGMNAFGALAAGAARPDDDDASPKGFITIMLFDKNRNFLDAAWDQLDGAYVQTGTEDNDPFDHLVREMTVEEEGYAYIFISNENATQVDIHFDDLKVTHTPTNVIQYNEYYPFGLSASTSWTRDGTKNYHLYNEASELNNSSSWYDLPFRNYDVTLARFMQVDPLADVDHSTSPFAYGENNPIFFNDPSGLLAATRMEIAKFIYKAQQGNGGRWSEEKAKEFYKSDDEAFYGGAQYMDDYNMWGGGGGGFASSFEAAVFAYTMISQGVVYYGAEVRVDLLTMDAEDGTERGFNVLAGVEIEYNQQGVGQAHGWEGYTPIWAPGRNAVDDFQNGEYAHSALNVGIAVSDIALLRSIGQGVLKGGLKLFGNHSWKATREYYLKSGFAEPYKPLHHWLIERNGSFGKFVPDGIKNQMWNLVKFENASTHMRFGHGFSYRGLPGAGPVGRFIFGTPTWFKASIGSFGGRVIE